MTDPISVEDFIATTTPRTEMVRVCARNDLARQHEELAIELQQVLRDAPDALGSDGEHDARIDDLAAQIVAVEEQMEAFNLEVHLSSIGAQAWADLLRHHPPRKRGQSHDPDTFPPAAVAACATEPKITEDQAQRMFATLHSAEWSKLWVAVVGLNEVGTPLPKLGAAADLLRANRLSAASPETTGSLAESSSVGSGAQ